MNKNIFSNLNSQNFKLKIKMHKVEHIGIAVKDLAVSIPLFEKLLDTICYKQKLNYSKVDLMME
jgi:hypothetical protein